jgi:hypothetical protein
MIEKIAAFVAKVRDWLKGWKTVIINAIIGLPAALLAIYDQFASVDITPLIPAQYAAVVVAAMALLGVVLRIITTGPVGSKGSQTPPPSTKAGD